jgi:hypothetical protein
MNMKKAIYITTLVLFAVVFSSCKKDRTCECTFTPGNTTYKQTLKKVTKRQAKANCFSFETDVTDGNTTIKVSRSCTLK